MASSMQSVALTVRFFLKPLKNSILRSTNGNVVAPWTLSLGAVALESFVYHILVLDSSSMYKYMKYHHQALSDVKTTARVNKIYISPFINMEVLKIISCNLIILNYYQMIEQGNQHFFINNVNIKVYKQRPSCIICAV